MIAFDRCDVITHDDEHQQHYSYWST